MRVMIVEDDPTTSALLLQLVKRIWSQAIVGAESDPFVALDLLREGDVDLLLLDWGLPGMSGIDVLKHIRRAGLQTVCVMITGHSDREDILAARAYHVDAYIAKPFNAPQVMARLAEIMALQRAPQEATPGLDSLDAFVAHRLSEGLASLPIDPGLVSAIEGVRKADSEGRVKIMRQCQTDPALLGRLLSLANRSYYSQGGALVETFEAALRSIGLDGFTNLAVELSLRAGSHLQDPVLTAKRQAFRRDTMSIAGIVGKLREHVEFDLAACRSASLLIRLGELAALQLMQAWIDDGHAVDDSTCMAALRKHSRRAGDELASDWSLPQPIRERIDAVGHLPPGTVRKEPVVMRIAGLLHAGDPNQELPRLLARFGLAGSKLDDYWPSSATPGQ